MNMRERLARAFLDGLPDDFYTIAGDHPASCVIDGSGNIMPAIDAVLDALMEPDEGMIEAGHRKPIFSPLHDDDGELYVRHGDVAEIWQAMLAAARTPEEK